MTTNRTNPTKGCQAATPRDAERDGAAEARLVAVGLGANLGDAAGAVLGAARELEAGPMLRGARLSRLYGSAPVGPPQPDYVNAVLVGESTWEPEAILARLQDIEAAHGRTRDVRWGPRTLDLDLLFVGDLRRDGRSLTLPHPGLVARGFVLVPLCDLVPDVAHPVSGVPFRALLAAWRREVGTPTAHVWPLRRGPARALRAVPAAGAPTAGALPDGLADPSPAAPGDHDTTLPEAAA